MHIIFRSVPLASCLLLLAAAPAERTGFAAAMDSAMARMDHDMMQPASGDADRDFAAMMIPHHRGAIDMAEAERRFVASIPLGRLTTPEDVANAALYLASDAAGIVTGIALEVDGGRGV